MSFLSLLSTVTYGPNGIIIPNGYVQTISSNGTVIWTSTLGLDTGLTVSTLRGSTLLSSEFSTKNIGYSTLTGSTLYSNTGTVSTLIGSTLVTGSVAYSTLVGSSLYGNSGTVSSLTGSTLVTGSVAYSTLVGSSLYANSGTVSSLTGSTLVTGSVAYSTLVGSSLYANSGTVSSLTGSTLVTGSVGVSTLTGSTLTSNVVTTSKINLNSTLVALGQSTTQTQTNFSEGSYDAGSWITAKSSLTNGRKVAMSSSGQYQIIVSGGTNDLWLSSDSGVTWTGLTTAYCGLPTLTGSAYWSSGTISASGQQIVLSVYGGSLWTSNDYGRTFALTSQVTPTIWLQLNGNLNDTMGGAAATAPGTVPGYVTVQQPGFLEQAVNLANTAGSAADRYIRGSWTDVDNFTVSFWFNAQSLGANQIIFSAYAGQFALYVNPSNQIVYFMYPSTNVAVSSAISSNTWYYITAIFRKNSTCSLYMNNTLIGTNTNNGGLNVSTGQFGVGTYDHVELASFNGYITDLRIYQSAIPYVSIPLLAPNVWLPFENNTLEQGSLSANQTSSTIYLPFEGSVTDTMNFTTVTPYGSPGYVLANRAGYTGQAINLVNTAGGQATQYLDCSWSGSSSFSVSFWYNMQTYNTGQTALFCAYQGTLIIMVYDNSISIYNSANGGIVISSGSRPANNTWHYVTYIHQNSGTCSLYLNNSLVGTYTNSNSLGTTTKFSLGTYDVPVNHSALNGYIDDFRLYNYAITYNPVSIMTVTGSLSYVPGVVGLNSLNLVNSTALNATASQYIQGTNSPGLNYTVSGWFNLQSIPDSTSQSIIFAMGRDQGNTFQITYRNTVSNPGFYVEFLNNVPSWIPIGFGGNISLNTWYHVYAIVQQSGTCSAYLNGNLIGTVAGSTFYQTLTTFSIGTSTPVPNGTFIFPFNGYIDDFRIYNAAIPFHVLFPQNYRSVALSGSGQYALASSAGSGWVVGSTDSGATWTKQPIVISQTNDFIQPNQPNLGASTWLKNGITWTASVSSVLSSTTYASYYVFNNTETDNNNSWTSAGTYSNGVYGGSVTTTVLGGIGAVTGEWIQIQTSTPLVLQSYRYSCAVTAHVMKNYYIVGSTDGTNWYPVQYVVGGSIPFTAWAQPIINFITVNFTGTQTVIAGNTVTITTTSYGTSTTPYNYFRVIANSLHTGGTYAELCELYMNFTNPVLGAPPNALTLSHTGQYQMVATGPAAGSIMPNQSGLADPKWSYSGVQWEVNASSFLGSWSPYKAFNNLTGDGWLSDTVVPRYTSGGAVIAGTTATTTVQGGIGTVTGEWIQLKSSIPLVLSSFGLGIGPNAWPNTNTPKTYYIVGSNDGVTWYPLQNGNFTIGNFVGLTNPIQVNLTGTQTFTSGMSGSVATTSYSYSTTAYAYFRLIGTSIMNYNGQGSNYMEIGEWYPVFSNSLVYSTDYGTSWSNNSGTVSNEIVSLSPSGQYSLSTNSVPPLARLTLDGSSSDSQGALVLAAGSATSYSSAIKKVGSHSAYFNNSLGTTSATNYLSYTLPVSLGQPPSITMAGWMYPTGYSGPITTPFAITYNNTSGGFTIFINGTGQIVGAINTTASGYSELISSGTVSLNTWTHVVMTLSAGTARLYVNGDLRVTISYTGLIFTPSGSFNTLMVGSQYISGQYAGPFNGYIDDVRLYTSALSAHEVASLYANPALTQAVGVSNSYLPITSYVKPVLPGATANVVDAKVSQTGQYMVVVTAGTTNNVYYSTDYGATFTNLTIGSSPMVSCAISHDGSYLIVTNATTTYTLNRNSKGFTLAVGSQAGAVNQALNSIAIGNKAGQINQSANSIILNGSGNTLGTVGAGFYVAPVFSAINSAATSSFPLLGYGTDSQIVSLGASVNQTGSISAVNLSHHQWNNMRISEIRESNIGSQPRYWKIASLGNPGGYSNWGQVTIKGYLGGFYTSESMYVDICIGSRAGFAINGIVRGTNIINAQAFMDLLYSSNSSGGYDIWLHIKSGIMFIGFDLDVGGDQTYPSTAYLYDPSNTNSVNSVPGPTTSITTACQMGIHGGGGSERTGIIASFLSQGMGSGTSNAIVVGKSFANNNCVTILHNHVADGSANNYLGLGYFGSDNLLTLKANGNVGIGTTNAVEKFHVEGRVAVFDTTNDIMGLFAPTYGNYLHIGSWNRQGSVSKNIVLNQYGGNIGIGSTNPAYTLDVSGTIRATGNIIANGTALPITNGSVWAQNGTIISYSGGPVGIGTANPTKPFVITSDLGAGSGVATGGIMKVMRGPNAAGEDNFWIGFTHGVDDTDSSDRTRIGTYIQTGGKGHLYFTTGIGGSQVERMRINGDGNVGIGTANPSYLLHGYGNSNGGVEMYWQNANAGSSAYCLIGVRNNIPSQMVMFLNSNTRTVDGGANVGTLRNDQGDLRLQGGFVTDDTKGIRIKATTQFVGIGTDSPGSLLHVNNGHIGLQSTYGISFRMDIPGYLNKPGASGIYATGLDALRFAGEADGGTQRTFVFGHHTSNDFTQSWNPKLTINSYTGNMYPNVDNSVSCGASTNRWTAIWAVNGAIQTSDSNVKDSQPLPYGINELLRVRTIKYKWKSQANLPDNDPQKNFEYYGFCADELGPLFPELVYDEDKSVPVQMNYTELLPVVVNALKEEHQHVESLKTTIENQKQQIITLETELGTTKENLTQTMIKLDAIFAWAQQNGFSF